MHAGAEGMAAHWELAGESVGAAGGCKVEPPMHAAAQGICAHLGSSGLVGRPGLGSSSRTGVPDVPRKPGVAFAGTVAPVAAVPISATATAVLVIAPRTPEAIAQLIRISPHARFPC